MRREYVSPRNKHFILHDSNGFEPGDLVNYNLVRDFILERSKSTNRDNRIHGIWCVLAHLYSMFASLITTLRLCTETPPAGGRVFEKGDEMLVAFAHEIKGAFFMFLFLSLHSDQLATRQSLRQSVPLVIVFTQYDRLVRTKAAELEEYENSTDVARYEEDARLAFVKCLGLVERTITRYLKVPMPRYCKVSGMCSLDLSAIRFSDLPR